MTKVSILKLDSVTNNDTTATATINTNFKAIQDAIENTLSRDGTAPNYIDADIDMNSHKIFNVSDPVNNTDVITKGWFDQFVDDAASAASTATAAANQAASSAQSAAIAASQAADVAGTVDAAVDAARDWAIKIDGTVDGVDYSSKYYASQITPIASDITTVAGISSDVTTVSGISADVSSVASNATDISNVAADLTNIDNVASDLTNIDVVNTNKTNIDNVANNMTSVSNVSTYMSSVRLCADDISSIRTTATDISNIIDVAGDLTNINAVNNNSANINTVATNASAVNTAATNISAITAAPTYAQAAEDWAIKMNGMVGGEDYSAKYYAAQAKMVRNIGEIVQSTIPLTDAGLHLLDGSLISGSGAYANFVSYIAGLVSTYPSLFTTEANWQSSVSTYGACDRYVYDSVNNTVRLPKRNSEHGDLIKSYLNGTDWYRVYSDGWCEQGGLLPYASNDYTDQTINLLLPFKDTNYSAFAMSAGTTARYAPLLYTKSTTQFTVYRMINPSVGNWMACGYSNISDYQYSSIYEYLVIATSTKTQIEVDIDEIATDMNGKADVDLSNITSIAPVLGMVQNTDSSKVGYVYTVNTENVAATTPSGGKWLILEAHYILNSNAVMYAYTDQAVFTGQIVNGGTLVLQARSGYLTVVGAIKIA